MKTTIRPTLLAVALAAAFPAAMAQQTNQQILDELRALRDRVNQLEAQLKAVEAKTPAAPERAQWGMTPGQAAEFNRIAIKTEALEDNFEDQGFKGLTISGTIDPTFIVNQRQKRAGFQFLNQQADGFFYDTSTFGSASITFNKELEGGTIWRLGLNPNRGIGASLDGLSIVEEANVSVPLADLQTRLILGQIPDWSGYEYTQPDLNPLVTHNLLYDFTLPVAYTGVGLDLVRGKWWIRTMVGNVNEPTRQQGERAPAFVYRVDYERGEFSGWGFAGLHGKTTNYNVCRDDDCESFGKTTTHLFEVDGWYTRGDLTLGGQVGIGMQKRGAIIPDADEVFGDARWWGVSGLVGWNFTPRLQGLVRADYIRNTKNGGGLLGYNGYWDVYGVDGAYSDFRNGIGPAGDLGCDEDPAAAGCNRGANRYALTVGLKYIYDLHTSFKFEYRFDGADRAVFYDVGSGGYKKNNSLFGASVVVSF
jgi:hypothetical protein